MTLSLVDYKAAKAYVKSEMADNGETAYSDALYTFRCAVYDMKTGINKPMYQSFYPKTAMTSAELSDSLWVAANKLQGQGATDAQIKYLVSIAVQSGEPLEAWECSTLSKKAASNLIDDMVL